MMILKITNGTEINAELLRNYFHALVNCIFKILPMKESNEDSLEVYMKSLQSEMSGCERLIEAINNDAMFLSLLSILQYQIDNPDCPINETRREVFRAIAICNKLKAKFSEGAR